jgi:Zn-dependent peptidase ImmA (M78 family)
MTADRSRLSLAHELGHIVMHTAPDDDEKMESAAHRFAAAFLMPASDIKPYLISPRLSTLRRVKAYWRVSIKALIKRAFDLALITPSQYKPGCSLCVRRTPAPLVELEPRWHPLPAGIFSCPATTQLC